jgi:hypothetical protein
MKQAAADASDLHVFCHDKYGKGFIKKCKARPPLRPKPPREEQTNKQIVARNKQTNKQSRGANKQTNSRAEQTSKKRHENCYRKVFCVQCVAARNLATTNRHTHKHEMCSRRISVDR